MARHTAIKAPAIVLLLITTCAMIACSNEDSISEEVSTVTDEGPFGGHSLEWYKAYWKTCTTEQRRWCLRQKEDTSQMQSCIDANIGWRLGRADPKTNPPRRWEDGSKLDEDLKPC